MIKSKNNIYQSGCIKINRIPVAGYVATGEFSFNFNTYQLWNSYQNHIEQTANGDVSVPISLSGVWVIDGNIVDGENILNHCWSITLQTNKSLLI